MSVNRLLNISLGIAIGLVSLIYSKSVEGNASQPGIWNGGGTVFTMLYPKDSLTFKKVQMQEERIYIQLYKGYAVVKGTYLFRNTTDEALDFKMGYPVNGIFYGGDSEQNEVILDSLSRFKIRAKENWLPLLQEAHPKLDLPSETTVSFGDNWKVWEMAFSPSESQVVEVYFIVNTNEARVQKGYNIEQRNAFIYLLESGNVWHQPIEKGHFYVQFMNDLGNTDISGISPGFEFVYNERHRLFAGSKSNFSPTPKDNLIVTYHAYNPDFTFDKIIAQADSLFSEIDLFSRLSFNQLTYGPVDTGDPYAVDSTLLGYLPGILTLLVLFSPTIIGLIIFAVVVWAVSRWIKINKRKNTSL